MEGKKRKERGFFQSLRFIKINERCNGNPPIAKEKRLEACKKGKILCGECKKELAKKIKKFLAEHQKKREAAKKIIDKFMLVD